MLLSFRVANHRSLRDEQHLNLAPVYDADRPPGTKWPAVPVAAIYGANASGKSNVIDAFIFAREMVLDSDRRAEPDQQITRRPFALDADIGAAPSDFDIDIDIDGVHYAYGFSIDDRAVVEEWLHRYPTKRRQIVFNRDGQSYRFGTTVDPSLREAIGITPPNALFLSVAARASKRDALPVYRWMRESAVDILSSVGTLVAEASLAAFIAQSSAARSTLVELLHAADVGIADVELVNGKIDPFGGINRQFLQQFTTMPLTFDKKVQFRMHGATSGRALAFHEQSDGTQEFVRQILRVVQALQRGSLLVIDELESMLHPNLAEQLIRLFQDTRTNPLGAQLVFTTHNTALLGSNAEVLKRDQVWFTEKGHADGATSLFPLTDFTPRDKENTERRYRGGSYGAVPFVDEDSLQRTVESIVRLGSHPVEVPRG